MVPGFFVTLSPNLKLWKPLSNISYVDVNNFNFFILSDLAFEQVRFQAFDDRKYYRSTGNCDHVALHRVIAFFQNARNGSNDAGLLALQNSVGIFYRPPGDSIRHRVDVFAIY